MNSIRICTILLNQLNGSLLKSFKPNQVPITNIGIKTKVVAKIPEPERYVYTFDGVKVYKQVNYFLMEYVSGDIKDHDWEMEEVEWSSFVKARERLDFPAAKKVLDKAKSLKDELKMQLELI